MFEKILILFIYVNCITSFLLLADKNEERRECYKRLTDEFFGKDSFVYVISDDMDEEVLIEISQPKIILNQNSTNIIKPKTNLISTNFVIGAKDEKSLEKMVNYLFNAKVLVRRQTTKGKFFIVTPMNETRRIFVFLWKLGMYHAVVLIAENTKHKNQLKWYWSNPFTIANDCGQIPNVIREEQCNDDLNFTVEIGFRSNTECPENFFSGVKNIKRDGPITDALLQVLERRKLNVKPVPPDERGNITHYTAQGNNSYKSPDGKSQDVRVQKWIWIIPLPERISPLRIFLIIFQTEVWIMVAAGFLTTLLLYIAALALYRLPININGISVISFHIYSLTLWGSCSNFPKIRAIRIFFLCYIFYAIVVQTAYVSSLVRVLTIPQYEKGINDLDELADSHYPLYVNVGISSFFDRYQEYNDVVKQFNTKLVEFSDKNQVRRDLFIYKNISLLLAEENAAPFLKGNNVTYKLIIESKLLGHYAFVFVMEPFPDFYFMQQFDESITFMKETGIYLKLENYRQYSVKSAEQFSQLDDEPQVLSLDHLYGLFTIFGIGLGISCVVFGLELVVNRLQRARAVPKLIHVLPVLK